MPFADVWSGRRQLIDTSVETSRLKALWSTELYINSNTYRQDIDTNVQIENRHVRLGECYASIESGQTIIKHHLKRGNKHQAPYKKIACYQLWEEQSANTTSL